MSATPPAKTLNLYQRLASLADKVGDITATSENLYKKKALGRGDIEKAIRLPLAEAGIVVIPSQVPFVGEAAPARAFEGDTQGPGLKLLGKNDWQATLALRLVNVDEPSDLLDIWWSDSGSNPAAAISFCLKSFWKALLHLDDDDDEGDADSKRGRESQGDTGDRRHRQSRPVAADSSPKREDAAPVTSAPSPNADIMAAMKLIAEDRTKRGQPLNTVSGVKQSCLSELGLKGPISEMDDSDLEAVQNWIALYLPITEHDQAA